MNASAATLTILQRNGLVQWMIALIGTRPNRRRNLSPLVTNIIAIQCPLDFHCLKKAPYQGHHHPCRLPEMSFIFVYHWQSRYRWITLPIIRNIPNQWKKLSVELSNQLPSSSTSQVNFFPHYKRTSMRSKADYSIIYIGFRCSLKVVMMTVTMTMMYIL